MMKTTKTKIMYTVALAIIMITGLVIADTGFSPYFLFDTTGVGIGDFYLGGTGLFYDYSTNSTDINDLDIASNLDVGGTCDITGALTASTLNTGQGANELFAMNQDLETTDTPTFAGATFSGNVNVDSGTFYVNTGTNVVGIGTTIPNVNYKLDVLANKYSDGRIAYFHNDGNSTAIIDLLATLGTETEAFYRVRNDDDWWSFGIDANENFAISDSYANTMNSRKFVISQSGDVGIGTTSPSSKLEVENGALTLDMNSNNNAFNLDSISLTATDFIVDNTVAKSSNYLASFALSNSGASVPVIRVSNAGTGNGLFIDQNGNGNALYIDSEATTTPAIFITTSSGGCSSGDYGFYTDSDGDIFWCKNGVSTQLN